MGFFRNILDIIRKISFGLVFLLILAFMFIRTDVFFPQNPALWKDYMQTSIIFIILFLGFASATTTKTTEPLFKISFLKESWKFLLSAAISFIIFSLITIFTKGSSIGQIAAALSGVSVGIIFLYAFLVSFPEQLIFFGRIPDELMKAGIPKGGAYTISCTSWVLYHSFLGKSIWTMLIYIPLSILFVFLREKYSRESHMVDGGAHFSWDIFIIVFQTLSLLL